jgi:F-type H+-transporting ATPase subunit delta
MAEISTIARPYAEAAFALADKAGALDAWSKSLARLAMVAADAAARAAVSNPKLSDEQRYALFASVAGDLSAEAQGFLRLLVANNRLDALPKVSAQFDELKNQREGVVDADIVSALPLDASQLSGLVADLERRFKRKVNPISRVDASLIGGLRVSVGDEVIDGSVRGKLAAMRTGLLAA